MRLATFTRKNIGAEKVLRIGFIGAANDAIKRAEAGNPQCRT